MRWLCARVHGWLVTHVASRRVPDFVVGEPANPYLRRWWLIPRNRCFNVYLHEFLRSDDDRALHDHPWAWLSVLLTGSYEEHTIAAGGVRHRRTYRCGSVRVHGARFAHRLDVQARCWTLFLTGPKVRTWGFHCPHGWVPWRKFTDPDTDGATVGRGCDQ